MDNALTGALNASVDLTTRGIQPDVVPQWQQLNMHTGGSVDFTSAEQALNAAGQALTEAGQALGQALNEAAQNLDAALSGVVTNSVNWYANMPCMMSSRQEIIRRLGPSRS